MDEIPTNGERENAGTGAVVSFHPLPLPPLFPRVVGQGARVEIEGLTGATQLRFLGAEKERRLYHFLCLFMLEYRCTCVCVAYLQTHARRGEMCAVNPRRTAVTLR